MDFLGNLAGMILGKHQQQPQQPLPPRSAPMPAPSAAQPNFLSQLGQYGQEWGKAAGAAFSMAAHGAETGAGQLANVGQYVLGAPGTFIDQHVLDPAFNALTGQHTTTPNFTPQNYVNTIHQAAPLNYQQAQTYLHNRGPAGDLLGGASDAIGQLAVTAPAFGPLGGAAGDLVGYGLGKVAGRLVGSVTGGAIQSAIPFIKAGVNFGTYNAAQTAAGGDLKAVPGAFAQGVVSGAPFALAGAFNNPAVRQLAGSGIGLAQAGIQQALDPKHSFDPLNYANQVVMGAMIGQHADKLDPAVVNAIGDRIQQAQINNAHMNAPTVYRSHENITMPDNAQLNPVAIKGAEKAIINGQQTPPIVVKRMGDGKLQVMDNHNLAQAYLNTNASRIPTRVIEPIKLVPTGRAGEGGFIQLPVGKDNASLNGGQYMNDPYAEQYINEQVASHSSPQDFLKQTVDRIWQNNKQGAGTEIIRPNQNTPGIGSDVNNGIRISNNNPFYSNFYAEYGKAPTKSAITDMVKQELSGKGGTLLTENEVSPHDATIYQQLQDREASIEAMLNGSAGKEPLPNTQQAAAKAKPNTYGLTRNMKQLDQFSPELKSQLKGTYTPFTDNAATMATDEFMRQPLDDAQKQVMATLAEGQGKHIAGADGNRDVKFGKQEVSNAGAVMKALDAAGRVDEATAIHNMLREKLLNAGQTGQAAKLIYNRTPEGLTNIARNTLSSHGVDLTGDMKAKLDGLLEDIKSTKTGSRENDLARGKYMQQVNQYIPTSTGAKALSLYKTGILSSPKTAVKVLVANPITAAGEGLSDLAAAPIDKAVSVFTGKRSLVAPNAQNIGAYASTFGGRGLQDAKTRLVDNIALPGSTGLGTNELSGAPHATSANFGVAKDGSRTVLDKATGGLSSKVLNGYTSSIGRVHGAIQTPFYEARAAQALMQTAQAEALNRGLSGDAAKSFVNDFMQNPPEAAKQQADVAAQYATNQQRTALGSAASSIQHTLPGGQIIAPITRIPGAVATQLVNYSPLGALKTAGEAVLDHRAGNAFDQQGFSRGMGRAVVGTAILSAGAGLASQGRVSGDYPKDQATQALWQAANIPANSVYVGGKAYPNEPWRNTGGTWQQVASPGGAPGQALVTGAAITDGLQKNGIAGAALQGATGAAKIATNQPYLTGISGTMNTLTNPSQSKSFYDQLSGSIVPNIIRDTASATDPLQRQTSVGSIPQSIANSVTNGIPGLRELNQPQVDVFGNQIPRNNGPVTAALNPFNPQGSRPTDLTTALGQLHNQQDINGKAYTTPSQIPKNYPITQPNGQKVNLTDAQRTQFIEQSGQAAQQQLNQLIQSDMYKNASPENQSKMISDIVSGQRSLAKQSFGDTGKLSSAATMAASGRLPTLSTTGKVTTGTSIALNPNLPNQYKQILNQYGGMSATDRTKAFTTQKGAEAQYELAKYLNDKANGNITDIQDISRQASLAKQLVGANYDKTVRDLYGLSKSQIYQYVTTHQNGQQLAQDLASYDQALYNNGLTNTLKFKAGLAPTARGGSGGTSRTARTSTKVPKTSPFASSIKASADLSKKMATIRVAKARLPSSGSTRTRPTSLTYKQPSMKAPKASKRRLV